MLQNYEFFVRFERWMPVAMLFHLQAGHFYIMSLLTVISSVFALSPINCFANFAPQILIL
jgi:hypothetical protein